MVIDDRDLIRSTLRPSEHHPPLVVDPYRMEALPTALQRFETVTRRNSQIHQLRRVVQIQDLATRRTEQVRRERPRLLAAAIQEEIFGQSVSEGYDHDF